MTRAYLADHHSRPIEIAGGEGCFVFDENGKRYLDFVAGWCVGNIGWRHPAVREAIEAEAGEGRFIPAYLRDARAEAFAKTLIEIAPGKRLSRAYRCTSGSEAVEMAIKCARAATGKPTIVSIDGVYHGHTYGAASAGDACTKPMQPCAPGFLKIPMPHPRYGASPEQSLAAFEALLEQRDDIAAFLSEPVWSNAGSIVPHPDFLPRIQELCRKRGILFIIDEVATGFGRCGKLFASELWHLEPDILCLGKGLTGGYATMGACLVSEHVYERTAGLPMYSTFGWLSQDLAATSANVGVIVRELLWDTAATTGAFMLEKLKPLEDLPFVAEVRGIGLLLGIEIVKNKKKYEPDWRKAVEIQDACAEAGLIIETAGQALFITPPLILTHQEAEEGCRILTDVMRSA